MLCERLCRRVSVVLVVASLYAAPGLAQTPPGPGWVPGVCQRSYRSKVVQATTTDDNANHLWTVPLNLINYASGGTAHANYAISPYDSWVTSDDGKAAWLNGELDLWCWQRHLVFPNGKTTDDTVAIQGPYTGGQFKVLDDQMCDEDGNLVDYGGTPCGETQTTGTVTEGFYDTSNCDYEYVTVQEDDGSGWYDIWSGYAEVCS